MDPIFSGIQELDDTEMAEAEAKLNSLDLHMVDHVGGYNAQSLLDKIRFMAVSLGVKNILLDHITLMISADETIDNEVKSTDVIMKQLRSLAEECDINIDIISHIRKRGGGQKSTYGGAQITMEELRGSGSLYQVANNVICLERDQHDEENKNKTLVRSLKSRLSGYTGEIGTLSYDETTGILSDVEANFTDMSTEY
jgi:twinkle protein